MELYQKVTGASWKDSPWPNMESFDSLSIRKNNEELTKQVQNIKIHESVMILNTISSVTVGVGYYTFLVPKPSN